MDKLMTIWNVAAASLAVWRLSRLLLEEKGRGRILPESAENIFGNRALDCICWFSVWLSAQTAIWVAGGLTGVMLNCFVFSHLSRPSRLSMRSSTNPTADCGMQAHHG